MTVVFQCPKGHQWPQSGTGALEQCPFCGAAGETIRCSPAQPTSKSEPEDQPTDRIPPPEPRIAAPHRTPLEATLDWKSAEHIPNIPGYQIIRELGRGGMGVVYEARHVRLNRTVALKMINAGAHSTDHLSRFQAEAEAVARLHHPNIVQIYEVGEHEGLPYLSLEFVGEGSLQKWSGRAQPARQAAELVETLARAMDYAHQRGIVHRDLKPSNILLADQKTPKIADFGLAKRMEEGIAHTQTGSILGTPMYMSPEQAAGKTKDIGPAVDIYALGAILYDLIAGTPPFKGESVLDTLEMVRGREPSPPSRLQPKIHRDLETICLKCLEKNPATRYASAAALADDLRRFLDGESILARPTSKLERVTRWVKRRPATAALLALLGIVIPSSIAAATLLWQQSRNAALLAADRAFSLKIPSGLPEFNLPANNPMTEGKVALGKQLYFDKRLSLDNSVSCATCHDPSAGWSNGKALAAGIAGQVGNRSAPTILNTAYQHFLFWDGRAKSLEEQALGPIMNPIEMGIASPAALEEKLKGIRGYREQFQQVFKGEITARRVAEAIAAFERTLLSGDAPYDRYVAGDRNALSEAAARGMDLFFNHAHCSACHTGPNFTDGAFHNIGIGVEADRVDPGRESVSGLSGDRASFRTPTLREIARTAPYMHDGSLRTLEEVIEYYDKGGIPNPQLDEELYPLRLTPQQKWDLETFLREGLSSTDYPFVEPPKLPE